MGWRGRGWVKLGCVDRPGSDGDGIRGGALAGRECRRECGRWCGWGRVEEDGWWDDRGVGRGGSLGGVGGAEGRVEGGEWGGGEG